MKKIKAVSLLLVICMALGAFASCSAVDVSEVMNVNGEKVTGGEYRFYLGAMKQLIAAELSKDSADAVDWENDELEGKKAIDIAKQRAYDDLVNCIVASSEAKKRGLVVSGEEKRAVSDSILSYFGGTDKATVLKECQLSEEIFNSLVEDLALTQKLQEEFTKDESIADVSEEEIRAKYDSLLEQYTASGVVTAKHILICFEKEDGTTRTEEETLEEANRIKAMVTDDNFDELVAQYSEDPGSATNPGGYTFTHGDGTMVQEFDDVAYALRDNEVSEPVKTSYGYHIIKRVASVPDFEAEGIKDELKSIIISERATALYDENVKALAETATVTKNEEKYNKIK